MQAVLWGVCKITEKRKLGLRGKWTEPGQLEWVGLRADPGGMYIRVVRQKLPHFLFSFSLYLSSRERNSLLSPCSLLLHRRGERAAARQPAVVGGGAAAVKALFFTFFLLSLILLSFYTFLTSKIKESKPCLLDLNFEK